MSSSAEKTPRRRVAILGATGSIGSNAVAVVKAYSDRFETVCVTCRSHGELLQVIANELNARYFYCSEQPGFSNLASESELYSLLVGPEVDIVLCAIQGIDALKAVLTALRAGKTVCLATKEVLVAAGAWVMATARKYGGRILPVDSEHCAVFQCLHREEKRALRRIILTCSGGPFHAHPERDLHTVTPEEAGHHPAWNMGGKITLDSATLMNKAFEVMEAAWLYGVPEDQIEVVVHPQAVVHSMVEFVDGAVMAQLGPTDMKLPIQYCLTYPERCPALMQPLDFTRPMALEFLPPDTRRFPALELARCALRMGGLAGAVLNAANDSACRRFREGTLAFDEIAPAVACALDHTPPGEADSFEALATAAQVADEAIRNV